MIKNHFVKISKTYDMYKKDKFFITELFLYVQMVLNKDGPILSLFSALCQMYWKYQFKYKTTVEVPEVSMREL